MTDQERAGDELSDTIKALDRLHRTGTCGCGHEVAEHNDLYGCTRFVHDADGLLVRCGCQELIVENFEGLQPRECGEHRTVGAHRAWCHDCTEWCYPASPCKGCELPRLRLEVARLKRERHDQ